ncbi:MAG TPA: hypothetical protein VMV53_04660 [Acidimicrobiales bacterium]|nr:hypothetical protein [Acidimicrobiales bacterium]
MILRRLFQFAVASSLAKAWSERSKKWLSVAGLVVLLRVFDGVNRHLARRARRRSS